MKKLSLLSAALAMILPALPVALAHSQEVSRIPKGSVDSPAPKRVKNKKAPPAEAAMFPLATRVDPEQRGADSLVKPLQELFALRETTGSEDELIAKADAILANPKATAFDKSMANYIAGFAWFGKDEPTNEKAIKYVEGAINDNGLTNNTHYQLMFQLAQMYLADGKHAESLKYVDRYLAETKSDDAKGHQLKAQIMLASDKPEDAAAAFEALLAKKPNDKQLMMNLISVYAQSGNDAKAGAIFDRMHKAGLLTESKDYDMAFRLLANIEGREKDAMAIIDEGLQKKILVPSYAVYSFQGRSYYDADQIPKAIEAWSKAAPLGKDGEMYLNVSKLHMEAEQWAAAKTNAKSALDKGVKRPGEAWQVLSRSEQGLGNKAAARAAALEAAKHPETRKWAEGALRQLSGK